MIFHLHSVKLVKDEPRHRFSIQHRSMAQLDTDLHTLPRTTRIEGIVPMTSKRIFFLDNLKAFIILLMVVFHAAMCYMAYAPEWWYVLDTQRVFSATLFVLWADIFIMPIMFFISGYFGLMSLSKRSQRSFWKSKLIRIGLPWAVGAICIAPVITYLMIASRNIPMDFPTFYTTLFWGAAYQQAQYWYLGALLALYLLLALCSQLFPGMKKPSVPSQPSFVFFLALILLGAAGVGIVNFFIPDGVWIHPLYLLVLQPTRLTLYILYFFLGAWAWKRQWFSEQGWKPPVGIWMPCFILMSFVYVFNRINPPLFQLPPAQTVLLNAFLHSAFCLTAIFGLISLFQQSLDHTSKIWGALAATSYPIYFLHQFFVQETAWLLRPLETNAYIKYLLTCTITLAICFLISKYLLLRLPCFASKKQK